LSLWKHLVEALEERDEFEKNHPEIATAKRHDREPGPRII